MPSNVRITEAEIVRRLADLEEAVTVLIDHLAVGPNEQYQREVWERLLDFADRWPHKSLAADDDA